MAAVRQLHQRAEPVPESDERGDAELIDLRRRCDQHQVAISLWCRQAAVWLGVDVDVVERHGPEAWRQQLQCAQRHLADQLRASTPDAENSAEPGRCQRQLKQLIQQRREILRRHGVQKATELKERFRQQTEHSQWIARRDQWQNEFDSRLPVDAVERSQIVGWLTSGFDLDAEWEQRRNAAESADQA